jgi:alpha-L-fucosidase
VQQRLLAIGRWLELNGEAIYGSRPWTTFGEGPTQVKDGPFGEKENQDFTSSDIRFTTKGDVLYAIAMGWPQTALSIRSLAAGNPHGLQRIQHVDLIGSNRPVQWAQTADALTVQMPETKPCDYAVVLRIRGA